MEMRRNEALNGEKVNMLEQALWFLSNILGETSGRVKAFDERIDYYLGTIVQIYHHNFNASVWKVMLWCFQHLSMELES
jgi:hypothetical protein